MMKYFLTILLVCSSQFLLGQSLTDKKPGSGKINLKDTIAILKKQAEAHSLPGTIFCRTLSIANNMIVNLDQIDTDPIKDISVLQGPESFKKYYYLGMNGTIEIQTKQKLNRISLDKIREEKYPQLEGKIIYAIDVFFVKDADLGISTTSLIETELIKIDEAPLLNSEYFNSTCICIWTTTKEQRANPESLCPRQLHGCYIGESYHNKQELHYVFIK